MRAQPVPHISLSAPQIVNSEEWDDLVELRVVVVEAVTEEMHRLFYEQTVEDVEAFLSGAPVRVLTAE